jgi:DNA-binding MarR family transcriptional regulator
VAIRIRSNSSTEAWRALLFAHATVAHELDRELRDETGLNLGWYGVLLLLASADGERLRMNELADQMILSRSATTRLVDRLERDGFVERFVCPSDRRGMEVTLTDAGRTAFIEAGRLHVRGIETYFGSHLSEDEKAMLTRVLGRIAEENARPSDCEDLQAS